MFAASKTAGASSGGINYIEDVFSTYLYTGNGSTQTITNGIDLSGKGGLTWLKQRTAFSGGYSDHCLVDTVRGAGARLMSDLTDPQYTNGPISAFTSSGFSLNIAQAVSLNETGNTIASWTFREQAKFFDIVTWTGNGSSTQTISHNLGAAPGCIITKSISYDAGASDSWLVYHRGLTTPNNYFLQLCNTNAEGNIGSNMWNVTSTTFRVSNAAGLNASGQTYVAYLFAHNAGGFGLTGTDNVISCGSYAGNGTTSNEITLGYEPQWLMIKRRDSAQVWTMYDNMRGIVTDGNDPFFKANSSDAETTSTNYISVTATGFSLNTVDQQVNSGSGTYIYIAIRRGPMQVPTSGTSVLGLNARTGTGANATVTGLAPTDLIISKRRQNAGFPPWGTRLLGFTYLSSSNTSAETSGVSMYQNPPFDVQDGVKIATASNINSNGETYINYLFGRAPSFMDVVCYTGTGAGQVVSHNLGVVPQLMIFKRRSSAGTDWIVTNAFTGYMSLNLTTAQDSTTPWDFNGTAPTATQLTTRAASNGSINLLGSTYVAYLFATCAGVSKVGSYTGNGTTQTIDCGFTGGARFVLIKRTDSTGDWYVYDTARGMTTLTDPYLLLNSTAAESATLGSVTTVSTGFALNASILAAINTNGASYIFLAIS